MSLQDFAQIWAKMLPRATGNELLNLVTPNEIINFYLGWKA